ncbi:MAG TPA: hypothetical protein VLQ45_31480 [Thermoanaerobaculia bacterium]|nr:hypothetical protein [Thermoanaerobaculia bacterium]
MTEDWLLLGFDARPSKPPVWDEGRKRDFLLRLDIVTPLSIDTAVWPSVFALHPELRPPYVGPYGLYENLESLRKHVAAARGTPGDLCIVAFGVASGACTREERRVLDEFLRGVSPDGSPGTTLPEINPPAADGGWSFLGYDVADLGGTTSGLMNCGFLPELEDVEALRLRWGPKLNDFHLFDSRKEAREFKDFSNQRVAEHAPFFIHGIWLVESEESCPTGG